MRGPYPAGRALGDRSWLIASLLDDLAVHPDLAGTWRGCATYWARAVHPGLSLVSARSIAWLLEDVDHDLHCTGDLARRIQAAHQLLLHNELQPQPPRQTSQPEV